MLRKPPLRARPADPPARLGREPTANFLGVQTPPAVVSGDTPITGKLSFSGPTRIDAVLRGEVHASDVLIVGQNGSVDGIVRAPQLVIYGEVRGEVQGAHRVQVTPSGRLLGQVETDNLVIDPGGFFDGDCRARRKPEA